MRAGGGRGAAAPPAFGQLSFLGSGGPFLGQQQWWEGGVFQFSGGRMTSRRQCPRGGGACEIPPPSGNPVSAPVICVKFWAINPSAPPNQSVPIRLCLIPSELPRPSAPEPESPQNCPDRQTHSLDPLRIAQTVRPTA